jgi:hypothetical protein
VCSLGARAPRAVVALRELADVGCWVSGRAHTYCLIRSSRASSYALLSSVLDVMSVSPAGIAAAVVAVADAVSAMGSLARSLVP